MDWVRVAFDSFDILLFHIQSCMISSISLKALIGVAITLETHVSDDSVKIIPSVSSGFFLSQERPWGK